MFVIHANGSDLRMVAGFPGPGLGLALLAWRPGLAATPLPPPSPTKTLEPSHPTCAPEGQPWASRACPESVWVRELVARAGGRIVGLTQMFEPQRRSAFVVTLDGYPFSLGAISKTDMRKMGGWFSMGEFSPHPEAFRAAAVRHFLGSGRSYRAVASELRISPTTLRRWVRQAEEDDHVLDLTAEEQAIERTGARRHSARSM